MHWQQNRWDEKNNALKFNLRYLRYGTTKQFWSLIDTSSNQKATIRTTTNSYPIKKRKHINYLNGIFSSMWVQSLEELLLFVTPLKWTIRFLHGMSSLGPFFKNRVHGIIENSWVYFISHLTKHKEINPLYIKSDSSDSQRILGRKTGFF